MGPVYIVIYQHHGAEAHSAISIKVEKRSAAICNFHLSSDDICSGVSYHNIPFLNIYSIYPKEQATQVLQMNNIYFTQVGDSFVMGWRWEDSI